MDKQDLKYLAGKLLMIRFTFEPCNFALNIFQNFLFAYFKHKM